MPASDFTFTFFLIFSGASLLASLALFTRQPLIIAYIVLGGIIGPYGMAYIENVDLLNDVSTIGIIFLLFLLGLDMQPKALVAVLRQATATALISSLVFFAAGYTIALLFNFNSGEALIIGFAMMFSSTIIGIKLLPTTVLHHKHTGELMIGLLLLQDMIAIMILLYLMPREEGANVWFSLGKSVALLPLLIGIALLAVKYIINPLIQRFDRFHEYIFLLAIGWCLGIAELGKAFGLSEEMGAFIAGVTLASSPISAYIATSLKPLRDFFLVLFFFALGAKFDTSIIMQVILPALCLATTVLVLKPVTFRYLLGRQSESKQLAWDIGFRLGQISEFSLLISFLALNNALIGKMAAQTIQATAIITFLISSYIVIFNYPNPIAVSDKLRRD